jgi:hypothetical protein
MIECCVFAAFKQFAPCGILAFERKDQRAQAHADNDQRTNAKENRSEIMGLGRS